MVRVELVESNFQVIIGRELIMIKRGHYKLCIIDVTAIVDIDLFEKIRDLFLRDNLSIVVQIAHLQLFQRKVTVTVGVEGFEHARQLLLLLLAEDLGGNEGLGGLLEG